MRGTWRVLFLSIIFTCIWTTSAWAGDILWRMTHGDQDALLLGKVIHLEDQELELETAKVLAGQRVPPTFTITRGNLKWPDYLKSGVNVVVSVDKQVSDYGIKWGIYQVTSLNYGNTEVIKGMSQGEALAFSRYINSDGKDNDFYFEESRVYVRNSDGTATELLPKANRVTKPASFGAEGENTQSRTDGSSGAGVRGLFYILGAALMVAFLMNAVAQKGGGPGNRH